MTYAPVLRPGRGSTRVVSEVSASPAKIPNLYLLSGDINPRALRWYRHVHGLTQNQIASLLNVAYRSYENWELGRGNPSERNTIALDMLVRATARTMEHYNGIIPPHERLSHALVKEGDDWKIREPDHQLVMEVMARRTEVVQELEEEIMELRKENHRLKADLAYVRREQKRSAATRAARSRRASRGAQA